MSIYFVWTGTPEAPCYEVDEFDNHKHYPISCSNLGIVTITATMPNQEWIDIALSKYYEYSLNEEALANAAALEMEIQDYVLLFPYYDTSLGSFGEDQTQYVINNQPTTDEEIQALVDLVHELGIY
jgi:hypothetical protein